MGVPGGVCVYCRFCNAFLGEASCIYLFAAINGDFFYAVRSRANSALTAAGKTGIIALFQKKLACFAGVVQRLVHQPSKLRTWVRLPSPAPKKKPHLSAGQMWFLLYHGKWAAAAPAAARNSGLSAACCQPGVCARAAIWQAAGRALRGRGSRARFWHPCLTAAAFGRHGRQSRKGGAEDQ